MTMFHLSNAQSPRMKAFSGLYDKVVERLESNKGTAGQIAERLEAAEFHNENEDYDSAFRNCQRAKIMWQQISLIPWDCDVQDIIAEWGKDQ